MCLWVDGCRNRKERKEENHAKLPLLCISTSFQKHLFFSILHLRLSDSVPVPLTVQFQHIFMPKYKPIQAFGGCIPLSRSRSYAWTHKNILSLLLKSIKILDSILIMASRPPATLEYSNMGRNAWKYPLALIAPVWKRKWHHLDRRMCEGSTETLQ